MRQFIYKFALVLMVVFTLEATFVIAPSCTTSILVSEPGGSGGGGGGG